MWIWTTVVNEMRVSDSFLKPDDIHTRYHLQEPDVYLNNPFLEKFGEDHPDFVELVEDWWGEEREFSQKDNGHTRYSISRNPTNCWHL
jgi:hypothetical protein